MWDRKRLGSIAAHAAVGIAVAGVALGLSASGADGKILPIASVHVSTATPTVGRRFTIAVQFAPGKDFVDAGWENFEITIVPAADTDRQGWPRSGARGVAVPIHRVAFGEFRGTATIRKPGDYVVTDQSGVDAHVDHLEGVVNIPAGAAPVRLHVVAVRRPSVRHTSKTLLGGGAAALIAIVAGFLLTRRRRRRRRHAPVDPEAASRDDTREPVRIGT